MKMRKKTQLIHGGKNIDKNVGAMSPPIYQASTFKQNGVGNFTYEYARTGNPTREAVETLIADLEKGKRGFAFASGMAAIAAVMDLFQAGDHFLITDDVYGGTYRYITKILNNRNIDVTFVNSSDLDKVKENIRPGVLAPHDSWLLIRGIRTLGIRMEEIESNTSNIVEFLIKHPKMGKVYYPGLPEHPNLDINAKQSSGSGGMVSFTVENEEKALEVLNKVNYFTLAESLGAVESLISLPAKMTHASIPRERRIELGIEDGLIRVSVGLEDVQDLIEDLKQALSD